uniref:Secreted protein n=1 Tax=Panagrellus redivivus TaxID=6233 RepID=A0A7E4VJM5_PANRE
MRLSTLIVLGVIGVVLAFDAEAPTESPRDADTSLASPVDTQTKNDMNELKKSIAAKVKKLRALKLEARQLQVQLKRDRRAKAIVSGTGENESEQVRLRKWKHRMQRRVKEMLKRVVKMEKTMKERKAELRQQMDRAKASVMANRIQEKHKLKKHQHGQQHPKKLNHQKPKKVQKTTTPTPIMALTTQSTKQATTTLAHTSLTTAAMSLATESPKSKQKRSHDIGTDGYPCATHKQCAPGHCCHRFGAINSVQASVCLQHDLVQGSVCGHSCACQGDMKCVRTVKKANGQAPLAHCRHMSANDVLHTNPSFRLPIHL